MNKKENYNTIFMNIDFINRYLMLSKNYCFDLHESFENYSNEKVIEIINELGYQVKLKKCDNYFNIVEFYLPFKFQFNIVLRYGIVELIWGIWENKLPNLQLSGPWGVIADNLGYEHPIRKPIFRNYKDLQEILKEAFSIFEDFKREVLTFQS